MTSLPPDDDDPSLRLVALIQAGIDPEENFERLYKRHYRSIRNFFLRRGFRPEEAHDLTQDVFLRVYRGIGTFRQDSRFETWIFTIASHTWKNELRRRSAASRSGAEESLDEESDTGRSRQVSSPSPSPLEDALRKERDLRLKEAAERLPPQMRQCFALWYWEGFKYREIAVLLNISIETVKAHIHQAKKKLQIDLNDDPGE